jgi:hypothetical protein
VAVAVGVTITGVGVKGGKDVLVVGKRVGGTVLVAIGVSTVGSGNEVIFGVLHPIIISHTANKNTP